jgi:hypothetical protein
MKTNLTNAWEWVMKRKWLRLILIRFSIMLGLLFLPSLLYLAGFITQEQYTTIADVIHTFLPFIGI